MGWTQGNRDVEVASVMSGGDQWRGLEHAAVGNVDWFIMECTRPGREHQYIMCMVWDGFYYKTMDETCCPFYYSVPREWLSRVPELPAEEAGYSPDWRARVLGKPFFRCANCRSTTCGGHAGQIIAVAACIRRHKDDQVPMVVVTACEGGRRADGQYASKLARYLVPREEYNSRFFVVDPARHPKLEDVQ